MLSAAGRPLGDAARTRRQTLVTAVYDLDPAGPIGGRQRPVAYYLPSLTSIAALGGALIVYTHPQHTETVKAHLEALGAPAIVIGREIETVPRFAQIQKLRIEQGVQERPWRDRCHVLCHAKVAWLAEQAEANPFDSERLYWIDAGLAYPGLFPLRYLPDYLTTPCSLFRPPVLEALEDDDCSEMPQSCQGAFARSLLMLGMQPPEGSALHNISLDDHLRFVDGNQARIGTQVAGALFGGTRAGIQRLYREYDCILAGMLDSGLLGTEENVLTIYYHRDRVSVRLLGFTTWYHEDSDVRRPGPDDVPFYAIFESLAKAAAQKASRRTGDRLILDAVVADSETWCPQTIGELSWTEMDGSYLLSCSGDDRMHVLNNVGVLLLELANGQHTMAEMAEILQEVFHLDQPPADGVRDFLNRAVRSGVIA